ncbi:MAG: DUF2271 domain-containing protein [Spirochaetaceae bacterium]|jgi:hypothetical protein|nr:DUF2271 domain-containing protein [Spirochaetaceae bacterium]
MKKLFTFPLFVSLFSISGVAAQASSPGRVEISFAYQRQSGFSSNQFAVWVEDAQGVLVKTLYATRFTATGGFRRRPESIPQWVRQAGLASQSAAGLDAFTGATPRSGQQNFVWDGTGKDGATLPLGSYYVYVEATLRGENRALYRTRIELGGGPVELQAEVQYFGSGTRERNMVGPVTVRVR